MSENSIYEETAYTEEEIAEGSESEYEMSDDEVFLNGLSEPFYPQKQDLQRALNFLYSDHGSDLYAINEQTAHFIEILTGDLNYIGQFIDHGLYRQSYVKKTYTQVEKGLQQLLEFNKANHRIICEEGLERGLTAMNKVLAFLALNPEEEKKKDKRAFYENCDNYSRLCDGVIRELEQVYKPFADDPTLSAELDHQIETLAGFSDKLEALIR